VQVSKLASDVKVNEKEFLKGDIVVSMSQPYRAFAKEVMERQRFPVRHYTPGGEIIKPYDITSWSLPLHRGIDSHEIKVRSKDLEAALAPVEDGSFYRSSIPDDSGGLIFNAGDNESFKAAFAALGGKLEVYRLIAPAVIEGRSYTAGTFIVPGNIGKDKRLTEMVSSLEVTPYFTSGDPLSGLQANDLLKIEIPRIALVETWFHDMDAGWTRYIFDSYNIPFEVLRPGDFEKIDLAERYDVILFPNNNKDILMSGKWKRRGSYYSSSYPPDYVKGIGKKGMEKLMDHLDRGGLIIAWGGSTELFSGTLEIKRGKDDKEVFNLPFTNLKEQLQKDGFYCPGAMLRLKLTADHPLTWGMPLETSAMFSRGTAFSTSVPRFDMDRRVIARFPEKDILLSGYVEKEGAVSNRNAMIWLRKGEGQLVLFGFNPQFRAGTAGTYKLLFNALLLGRADTMPSP
jgi:hypothetical protein